jgi:isoquinoline 1-oxidoreductase subunit alpha
MISLTVNGQAHELDLEPEMPLLWVLRDELGLTGTKFGCGIGQCGACTVLMNGTAVRSCLLPLVAVGGAAVTTIEGLGGMHPVQRAWIEHDVPQCGYCQSGQILAAASLIRQTKAPTDHEIDAAITNICRCGTYPSIRAAIHRAAELAQG